MVRGILIIGAMAVLSACSGTPQTPVMAQFKPQYCHTQSEHTLVNDEKASSRVDVKCTDNPEDKHFLAYSGIAKTCREHYYDVWYHGKRHKQRGFVCKKIDGSWEVVYHPFN